MKIFGLAFSVLSLSAPLMAANAKEETITLGSEQTYTVENMKQRCQLFQDNAQLKPFNIRVECDKTQNIWEQAARSKQLPHWVDYRATGAGKGRIQEENSREDLGNRAYSCFTQQEKTTFFKGNLELSCAEFIQNAKDLVSLCRDGYTKEDGTERKVEWQQVGEPEMGTQMVDGCNVEVQQLAPQAETEAQVK